MVIEAIYTVIATMLSLSAGSRFILTADLSDSWPLLDLSLRSSWAMFEYGDHDVAFGQIFRFSLCFPFNNAVININTEGELDLQQTTWRMVEHWEQSYSYSQYVFTNVNYRFTSKIDSLDKDPNVTVYYDIPDRILIQRVEDRDDVVFQCSILGLKGGFQSESVTEQWNVVFDRYGKKAKRLLITAHTGMSGGRTDLHLLSNYCYEMRRVQ